MLQDDRGNPSLCPEIAPSHQATTTNLGHPASPECVLEGTPTETLSKFSNTSLGKSSLTLWRAPL